MSYQPPTMHTGACTRATSGVVQRVRPAGVGRVTEGRRRDGGQHASRYRPGLGRDRPLRETEIARPVGEQVAVEPRLPLDPGDRVQAVLPFVAKRVELATRVERPPG